MTSVDLKSSTSCKVSGIFWNANDKKEDIANNFPPKLFTTSLEF